VYDSHTVEHAFFNLLELRLKMEVSEPGGGASILLLEDSKRLHIMVFLFDSAVSSVISLTTLIGGVLLLLSFKVCATISGLDSGCFSMIDEADPINIAKQLKLY